MRFYKNNYPLVSIVLPTYNRAGYLTRSIKSVLTQTINSWELIIIDDGSNDNSFEIIKNNFLPEERIKYHKQSHKGISESLNNGIRFSKGKFITFLGSDDKYLPQHLELRVEFLKKNPKTDLIHGGLKIVGNPYVPDKNDLTKTIHLENCAVGGTFFGKKEVFEKLGGFKNIPYSEDSEFLERASKHFNISKVHFPTYVYYRDTQDSITNTIKQK